MAQVVWSPRALRDIETIRDHIGQDNWTAAAKVLRGITGSVKRLETFPLSGREIHHRRARGAREIIRRPYRIAYDVQGDTIRVLRVHHGAQDVDWATLADD